MSARRRDPILDDSGATLIEFAIVAPVMLLMLIGFFDLGHSMYVRAVLQGAVQKAGRDSGLESGTINAGSIDTKVQAQVRAVTGSRATFSSRRQSYSSFSQVADPEAYVDANSDGNYDVGECYEDENGNGSWDADMGRSGQGGASDIVLYSTTVSYPRLFPMAGLLGWSPDISVSASTILRNQPYGAQTIPSVTRCT